MHFVVVLALLPLALGGLVPEPQWSAGCGKSKYADAGIEGGTRIVGGWEARRNEFPWQVSLERLGSHTCGGVVITNRWVLTAAHCVGSAASAYGIVVGGHEYNEGEVPPRVTHACASYVRHPDYDSSTIMNDIAVMQTAGDITFNPDVQPACKPVRGDDYTGQTCHVSGWGSTFSGGSTVNILRYVNMPVMANAICAARYAQAGSSVTDDMLCAGTEFESERDACQGDSGGPLVVKKEGGGEQIFEIVGLVSWGIGCASNYPGVYCRVPVFNAWIDSIIGL